jgi:hypothetical protein
MEQNFGCKVVYTSLFFSQADIYGKEHRPLGSTASLFLTSISLFGTT